MAGAADKVDILKPRLGYGQSGNSGIDPYQSLSKYDMTTNGILGQNKVSGATLTNYMENPDLKWKLPHRSTWVSTMASSAVYRVIWFLRGKIRRIC